MRFFAIRNKFFAEILLEATKFGGIILLLGLISTATLECFADKSSKAIYKCWCWVTRNRSIAKNFVATKMYREILVLVLYFIKRYLVHLPNIRHCMKYNVTIGWQKFSVLNRAFWNMSKIIVLNRKTRWDKYRHYFIFKICVLIKDLKENTFYLKMLLLPKSQYLCCYLNYNINNAWNTVDVDLLAATN